MGLGTGLLFTLWMGIGVQVYKPAVGKAPVSVQGCPVDNCTFLSEPDIISAMMRTESPNEGPG